MSSNEGYLSVLSSTSRVRTHGRTHARAHTRTHSRTRARARARTHTHTSYTAAPRRRTRFTHP